MQKLPRDVMQMHSCLLIQNCRKCTFVTLASVMRDMSTIFNFNFLNANHLIKKAIFLKILSILSGSKICKTQISPFLLSRYSKFIVMSSDSFHLIISSLFFINYCIHFVILVYRLAYLDIVLEMKQRRGSVYYISTIKVSQVLI